jgi:hypothetical protein
MEMKAKEVINYIGELRKKVIEKYSDSEYLIEIEWNGAIQAHRIKFGMDYSTQELEMILPIVWERGAEKAGQKLQILLEQYQKQNGYLKG